MDVQCTGKDLSDLDKIKETSVKEDLVKFNLNEVTGKTNPVSVPHHLVGSNHYSKTVIVFRISRNR